MSVCDRPDCSAPRCARRRRPRPLARAWRGAARGSDRRRSRRRSTPTARCGRRARSSCAPARTTSPRYEVRPLATGEGIACAATPQPGAERVELAEAGFAITSSSHDGTLTARDLATGARRWRKTRLGEAHFASGLLVRRVGGTLLVVDRAGVLRGLDLKTGTQRWAAPPPSDSLIPAIASPDLVASHRCEGEHCVAEVRSIADGSVRWRAPVDYDPWLGSPPIAQSLGADRSLWPASAVILRTPPEGRRYEVRRLDTGKVVARGRRGDGALGVVGNLFLREDEKGELTATDVTLRRAGLEARRRRPVAGRPHTGRLAGLARAPRRRPDPHPRAHGHGATSRSPTRCACSTRAPASSPSTQSESCPPTTAARCPPTARRSPRRPPRPASRPASPCSGASSTTRSRSAAGSSAPAASGPAGSPRPPRRSAGSGTSTCSPAATATASRSTTAAAASGSPASPPRSAPTSTRRASGS